MKKNEQIDVENRQSLAQIDSIIVLLSELLQQICGDKKSVQAAREKAAVILVTSGFSRERAAKLVGMKKAKVVSAIKNIKI